ncbi:MAG: hypothetical protein K8R12_06070, partial [Desulfobacterales bacterium]|nr:hypothetical protein [Desulfobacterales bacterium]
MKICLDGCKEKFNQILSGVLNGGNQDAHKMEASIFNQLIKLGFILMQLYFASRNKGNYGKTTSNSLKKIVYCLINNHNI